jgi:hypothetical protein
LPKIIRRASPEEVLQALPAFLDDLLRNHPEAFALEERSGRSAGFRIDSAKAERQRFILDPAQQTACDAEPLKLGVHEHHVEAAVASQIRKSCGLSVKFRHPGRPADPSLRPSVPILDICPGIDLSR